MIRPTSPDTVYSGDSKLSNVWSSKRMIIRRIFCCGRAAATERTTDVGMSALPLSGSAVDAELFAVIGFRFSSLGIVAAVGSPKRSAADRGAEAPPLSATVRYIGCWSRNSQSGFICGKRRNIFWTRSKLGLFRPARMWEIPEGWMPSNSASLLGVRFSFFIKESSFSRIIGNFYKNKLFFFCKQIFVEKCKSKSSVDIVYKCNSNIWLKSLRVFI